MSQINGPALAAVAVGSVLLYAGIKGYSIPQTVQDIITGKAPVNQTKVTPINDTAPDSSSSSSSGDNSGGGNVTPTGGQPGGTDAQNQALGKKMAASYGWDSGAEWTAINNIAMAESGWSDTVTNSSSGAAGIAQRISGFGPGYESGNAQQQITWFYRYIKSRYGDPIAAWNFHLANNWY